MGNQVNVRKEPRISINKLAEYLTSSPRKRNTIVKNLKRPPTFKTYYYQPSQDAIINFLSTRPSDFSIIADAITKLKSTTIDSDYQSHRVSTNINALKFFVDTSDDVLNLDADKVKEGEFNPPKLTVSNVDISVRPELITYTNNTVGAIKLYFKKNDPLKSTSGKYAATALHKWTKENYSSDDWAVPKDAVKIYDVFSAKTISAPQAHINREKDISAACQEIEYMWPHM